MKILYILLPVTLFVACNTSTTETEAKTPGISPGFIDSTTKPGDNFFRYANGSWMDTVHFPTGQPSNGALLLINEKINDQIGGIVKEIASGGDYAANSPEGQIKALYTGFMDTAGRNALGFTPIKKEMDEMLAAGSKSDIARLMASPSYPCVFDDYVFLDSKNPNHYLTYTGQPKLTLRSIEAYLLPGEPYTSNREAYVQYVETAFKLAGIDQPEARAAAVLKFETALAKCHWAKADTRDPVRMYHIMSPDELKAYAPGFDWDTYWKEKGREGQEGIIVHMDSAVKAIAQTVNEASLDEIRSFMVFQYINSASKFLTQDLNRASFNFFEKKLMGVSEPKSLETSAIESLNTFVGDQLGKVYCDKYYTPELKAQVEPLVQYMKDAVRSSLQNNPWMDEPTRKEALRKFDNIHWKVGAPEKFHDYSGLSFKNDDLIGNLKQLMKWTKEDNASKLKESKRDWEWLMAPQVANAYYQAEMNDVVLPVGILQPPIYDPKADPAALFGGLLAVVGHEVCHGFDDKGSQSDADGILKNWWSDPSRAEFNKRAGLLAAQYDKFEPLPGLHINGRQTLGENIGDLGGINIAYRAYHNYVNDKQGGKAPVIDGLTGDQRFFLAWGQVWSLKTTEQIIRLSVLIDYHSLNDYRVNGIVRNLDKWYDAFNIQPGDSLYLPPDQRIVIY